MVGRGALTRLLVKFDRIELAMTGPIDSRDSTLMHSQRWSSVVVAPSAWCTEATTIEPAPTAEATRLIHPDRTFPTAESRHGWSPAVAATGM
jgi:hypothetical protein